MSNAKVASLRLALVDELQDVLDEVRALRVRCEALPPERGDRAAFRKQAIQLLGTAEMAVDEAATYLRD